MKGELGDKEGISLISHEIKNSLSGLKTGLGMLREMGEGEIKELSSTLFEELEYLQDMTYDVLSLTGPLDLKLEKVNIKKLSKESSEAVTGDRAYVVLEFSSNFPEVSCDKNLMKTVLINLIHNAYEEVDKEGVIEIGGKFLEDDMVKIWVKDNGMGIKGDINSIFRNFKSRRKTGTGIGLTLVRKIVAEHFGKISVESTYGEGTKFIIEMPSDFHYIDRRTGEKRRRGKGRRKED